MSFIGPRGAETRVSFLYQLCLFRLAKFLFWARKYGNAGQYHSPCQPGQGGLVVFSSLERSWVMSWDSREGDDIVMRGLRAGAGSGANYQTKAEAEYQGRPAWHYHVMHGHWTESRCLCLFCGLNNGSQPPLTRSYWWLFSLCGRFLFSGQWSKFVAGEIIHHCGRGWGQEAAGSLGANQRPVPRMGGQSEARIVSPGMIQCTMELPLVTSVLWPQPDTDQYRSRQPHQWTQSSPLIGHQPPSWPLIGHQPHSASARGQWGHPGTWTVTRGCGGWAGLWAASPCLVIWPGSNDGAHSKLDPMITKLNLPLATIKLIACNVHIWQRHSANKIAREHPAAVIS